MRYKTAAVNHQIEDCNQNPSEKPTEKKNVLEPYWLAYEGFWNSNGFSEHR